jgi:alpha,alpha-trehalase
MSQPGRRHPRAKSVLRIDQLDAVIFDMDGVVTDTAQVHAQCWKRVFDHYLRARSNHTGEAFVPFTNDDYLLYVDGKPRYDGAASFLSSRGTDLRRGQPSDPPGYDTICAIANLKDREFEGIVNSEGVTPFPSTITFIHALRSHRLHTALISSSRHAKMILAGAGIMDLFDVVVDGIDAEGLALLGKPDPAIFLTAARQLAVTPSRAAIVEDALAGVEAGRRGRFRVVVGIDRVSQAEALRQHGADIVVKDLAELEVVSTATKEQR